MVCVLYAIHMNRGNKLERTEDGSIIVSKKPVYTIHHVDSEGNNKGNSYGCRCKSDDNYNS